jgi:predicted nucleotidyltransferase
MYTDRVVISMSRERADSGEYVERVTLDAVLSVFETVEGPVVTSADVADVLDCSRETARRKLSQLVERGRVSRRTTAGRVVWWLTDPHAPRDTDHEQAFEAFAERLTEKCGDDIEEIILYGSVARGDHRENSDVDVLIITSDETTRERVHDHASTISFNVMIEYDVLISKNIKTKKESETQKDGSYLSAVRQDGRVYACF